jgi:hypothetical protein
MSRKRSFLFLAALVVVSLACGLFSGRGNTTGVDDSPSASGGVGGSSAGVSTTAPTVEENSSVETNNSGKYDTEFPLPDDVQNFMKLDENTINYQTSLTLPEVVDFYRAAFQKAGYEERDILTVIEDTTISLVWDGHPSGKAIVVQGVDLGNGTTNVNVRFEDV